MRPLLVMAFASVPKRHRRLIAAMAAVVGCCTLASCATTADQPPPDPLTLSVVGRQAAAATLRVRFAPNADVKDAERVQTLLEDHPMGTLRSVLKFPFRTMDVAVEGGDPGAFTKDLRARLAENRSVESVDTCPCSEEQMVHPEGSGLHKLSRSCAATASPLPASACVNKFVRLQSTLVVSQGQPNSVYAFFFEAAAAPDDQGRRVDKLKAAINVGESAKVVWMAPLGGKTLEPPARLPLTLVGFEGLDKSGRFSPGRVDVESNRHYFNLSVIPQASERGARVEGAVAIAVPTSEDVQERYEIVVEYR